MAESKSKRKPRIRKTAPTIREAIGASQAVEERPQNKRVKIPNFAGRLKLPQNKATSTAKVVLGKLAPKYFVNSWREVRQVTWTSRRETWRLTLAVFIFAIIFGALVAGVDKGLDVIFKHTVLK